MQDRLTEQLKYSILFILVILNVVQISSNGENVIGESVTRHFTGEFSVYSMAVRPAGSEAATVDEFDMKMGLVQVPTPILALLVVFSEKIPALVEVLIADF